MQTKVDSFIFDGKIPGKTLAILGAVHGNEKCGTEAIEKLKNRLQQGDIVLSSGRLIVVPVANPEAYRANKRFIERNLNRCLYPKTPTERKYYEDQLDHQICAVLDEADYLLDIHSYTVGGPPFLFLGCKDIAEKEFALALGVSSHFVWGWQAAFRDSSLPEKEGWGTTEYIRSKGGRGVTLECGQHEDPKNTDVAYAAIWRAMAHLGLCSAEQAEKEIPAAQKQPHFAGDFARMVKVIRNEGVTLAGDFKHFEFLKAGTAVAVKSDGTEIKVDQDGYVILPNAKAAAGAELVYLAVRDEPFAKSKIKTSL